MKTRELLCDAWEIISRELNVSPSMQVINDPHTSWAGAFHHDEYMVTVNISHLRTARDMITVLAHEMRHAWQYVNIPHFNELSAYSFASLKICGMVAYNLTAIELDANMWSFDFEARYKYKNEVLNPEKETSQFVRMKQLYADISAEEMDDVILEMKVMFDEGSQLFR